MLTLITVKKHLQQHANPARAKTVKIFFKNSQQNTFLGVGMSQIRLLAKAYLSLSLLAVRRLMQSTIHEEQNLAYHILMLKYQKGDEAEKEKIFQFYLKNLPLIQDWNGTDGCAPYIVGVHLRDKDKKLLYTLAKSRSIWKRRVAMVATLGFIRQNQTKDTFKLASVLLQDKEDLMHKAVGWMLREAGKRDMQGLKVFLNKHHKMMPRTMLRYAIEKLAIAERKRYLSSHS